MSKITNRNWLSRGLNATRDLLFPPRCISCGDLLPPFDKTSAVFCPLCRTAWESAVTEAADASARDCAEGRVYLTFYHSGQTDGVPERLIYHIKHEGDPRAFYFVADRLGPRVIEAVSALPDVALDAAAADKPLPLLFTYPPRRRSAVREDGFDQAARLAKALSVVCEGEFASLIHRTHRKTSEQKRLDAAKRAVNAARSYALKPNAADRVQGRTVVLCDDLFTTGVTLAQCTELLTAAGARRVIWVTVARTSGKDP